MRLLPRDVREALRAEQVEAFEILDVYLPPDYDVSSVRLCKTDEPQNVGGLVYTPYRWNREATGRSVAGDASRTTITVEDPQGQFAKAHTRFDFSRCEVGVSFVLRDFATSRADIVPLFRGRGSQPAYDERAFSLQVIAKASIRMDSQVPGRTFNHLCPYRFGDEWCGFDLLRPEINYTGIASAESDEASVFDFGLTQPAGFWTPGMLWVEDGLDAGLPPIDVAEYVPGSGSTPGVVRLFWPYPFSLVGAKYRLRRVCPKTVRACRDDFDNIENFGGVSTTPRPVILSGQGSGGITDR